MSTLLVDEIYTGVTINQNFRINRNISISSIRPWVYKHGTIPAGTFELSLVEGGEVLATSTIDASEINSSVIGTYAHGSMRFDFSNLILNIPEKETTKEYTLRFTFSAALDNDNFLGLVRRWEAKTYPTYGDALNDSVEPFGLEIFEYTENK